MRDAVRRAEDVLLEVAETLPTDEVAVGTEASLADCYEKVGKTASAWATFKSVATEDAA